MAIDTQIFYESQVTLVLLLVVLASTRGSFWMVCPSLGNWGSSPTPMTTKYFWWSIVPPTDNGTAKDKDPTNMGYDSWEQELQEKI